MLLEPIHAVTVCVDHADFLAESLQFNRGKFQTYVVVTSAEDEETQRLAGKFNCVLVATDDAVRFRHVWEDGPVDEFKVDKKATRAFNKGALVERGLQQLPQGGWRLHLDADVVLPGNFHQLAEASLYDKKAIYGADRFNVVGPSAWASVQDAGFTSAGFEYHHFLAYPPAGCQIGSRFVYKEQGWLPIGYFQMWHASAEYSGIYRTLTYPTGSSNAAHDDVQFALKFDRKKRIMIPELFVAHLTTADAGYAKNWNGRVTQKFTPLKHAARDGREAASVRPENEQQRSQSC